MSDAFDKWWEREGKLLSTTEEDLALEAWMEGKMDLRDKYTELIAEIPISAIKGHIKLEDLEEKLRIIL